MKRLAILGASGHGKVIAEIAEVCGWEEVIFYDDAWPELECNGVWRVSGDSERLINQMSQHDGVIVAIGNNATRAKKLEWLLSVNAPVTTLVHPSAVISPYAQLGVGTVIMAGVVVNVDSLIGQGVILNTGCSVDHDCFVDDCVHISPGARLAGGVKVGRLSWVGIGAVVRQLISIGEKATVGAGASVVDPVADGLTVAGVPARPI